MIGRVIVSIGLLFALSDPAATQDVRNMVRKACKEDYMRFCANVPPTGGGMKALQCLLDHRKEVSKPCQTALLAAKESQANSKRGGSKGTSNNQKNWSAE